MLGGRAKGDYRFHYDGAVALNNVPTFYYGSMPGTMVAQLRMVSAHAAGETLIGWDPIIDTIKVSMHYGQETYNKIRRSGGDCIRRVRACIVKQAQGQIYSHYTCPNRWPRSLPRFLRPPEHHCAR